MLNLEVKSMLKHGNLDLEKLIKPKWTILNKEFGSTLCDKLSHMVWEGGKAAVGGYMGEVINEPRLVPPVLELVLMT